MVAKEPAAKETRKSTSRSRTRGKGAAHHRDMDCRRWTTATAARRCSRAAAPMPMRVSGMPAPANGAVLAEVAAPEQPQSFGSKVFSTVSNLTGKAANFTGDTANFVIDLPGKLISAGGRLFDRQQQPPAKREAL